VADQFYVLVPTLAKGCRYTLKCDDAEVGSVLLMCTDDRLEVWSLEILPEYRGLGHGRAMMQSVYAVAHHLKIEKVWLRCNKDNPVALAMYAKEGFEVVEERSHDYAMERAV
jgi:ribosomal protein S18 acetylase RimI-like enzyme